MQNPIHASPNRLIGGCSSWVDFWRDAASLSEKQKGDVFERLVQLDLLTKPKFLGCSLLELSMTRRSVI